MATVIAGFRFVRLWPTSSPGAIRAPFPGPKGHRRTQRRTTEGSDERPLRKEKGQARRPAQHHKGTGRSFPARITSLPQQLSWQRS
jgi:hypothetical protein